MCFLWLDDNPVNLFSHGAEPWVWLYQNDRIIIFYTDANIFCWPISFSARPPTSVNSSSIVLFFLSVPMLFTQELKPKPKNIISRLISLTPHSICSIISWKRKLPVSSNPVNASSFMTRANCTWRDSAAWGRARRWSSPLRSRPRGWSQSGSPDPAEQRVWAVRGDPRVRRSDVQRLTGKSGPVQSQDVFEMCSLTLSLWVRLMPTSRHCATIHTSSQSRCSLETLESK